VSALEMAVEERRDLLELLRSLDESQWDEPTLCEGWTVRDVVAHVVSYDSLSRAQLAARFAQGRFWLSRVNQAGLASMRDAPPQFLLDAVERHLRPAGLTTAFGGRIALVDALIHHQDIRRPLGLPRVIPTQRLRTALRFSLFAPPIRGAWHARGVRLVATDLDWSFGRGPEARGPGEAVLMAMAGRKQVAQDLAGPGAERLRSRLG
jgi:uncharacterized protein (TIGR03083 family)